MWPVARGNMEDKRVMNDSVCPAFLTVKCDVARLYVNLNLILTHEFIHHETHGLPKHIWIECNILRNCTARFATTFMNAFPIVHNCSQKGIVSTGISQRLILIEMALARPNPRTVITRPRIVPAKAGLFSFLSLPLNKAEQRLIVKEQLLERLEGLDRGASATPGERCCTPNDHIFTILLKA